MTQTITREATVEATSNAIAQEPAQRPVQTPVTEKEIAWSAGVALYMGFLGRRLKDLPLPLATTVGRILINLLHRNLEPAQNHHGAKVVEAVRAGKCRRRGKAPADATPSPVDREEAVLAILRCRELGDMVFADNWDGAVQVALSFLQAWVLIFTPRESVAPTLADAQYVVEQVCIIVEDVEAGGFISARPPCLYRGSVR